MSKRAIVFTILMIALQTVLSTAESPSKEIEEQPGTLDRKRDCVCMNWRSCHGSINSE